VIPGISGSLLSHDALEALLRSDGAIGPLSSDAAAALRRLRNVRAVMGSTLGPASAARAVFDLLAEPLARTLGFTVLPAGIEKGIMAGWLQANGTTVAILLVTEWGQPTGIIWRTAIHAGLSDQRRWCICVSGPAVRVIDVDRPHARRYAQFDLEVALRNDETFAVLWAFLHASALTPAKGGSRTEQLIAFCERHRTEVSVSLREGVHDALLQLISAFRTVARKRRAQGRVLDEALIVVYRILFLLFAEARGLVPAWHPIYREGYTIEALRSRIQRPGRARGVWETLQAIARLAHRGCRAGALRVPPFNGHLFSPADAPLADSLPLDDRGVADALDALTTRKGRQGLEQISYADLGVEQLGAVYEHLLDYDLGAVGRGAPAVLVPTGRRKATGSFYTPRSLTEFVVRRTLAPLVQDATPEQILALRVLDPAMGSGAFLVAACRFLASAYEQSLVRDGTLHPADIEDDDRAEFRRAVAQRCLFGVDVNPMAVQLARLSLWLATLAADRPLTFLDHHLRPGNSLVGASMDDVVRNPGAGASRRDRELPLFRRDHLQQSLEAVVSSRLSITNAPDDTLDHVRAKERALVVLDGPEGPLNRWKAAADLWCAAWFDAEVGRHNRATFRAVMDHVLGNATGMAAHLAARLAAGAKRAAAAERFFHWAFEFPEVFHQRDGIPLAGPGFDVIVGNPPWEMLRKDGAPGGRKELRAFVRTSGLYTLQSAGHTNLYHLFVERAIRLLKPAGRAGLVVPGGLATDHAAAGLRRYLVDRTTIDTFTTLDNRDAIFPVHRALKFLVLTFRNAGSTRELPARAGVRPAEALDRVPDVGVDPIAIRLSRPFLERAGGRTLAVPELPTPADLEIVSDITLRVPALGHADGWDVQFGRELNATEDRPYFRPAGRGMPVLEGKHLQAFQVDVGSSRQTLPERTAARLLGENGSFRRARLAYRDVASGSNRMTLIAAVVPAGVVTTHTVFCLKEALDRESQEFLCGVFNSYVANYLVRTRVATHVTAALMRELPVPRPDAGDDRFRKVAAISKALAHAGDPGVLAQLNAIVARLYGLTASRFEHILTTFPLIPSLEREAALKVFTGAAEAGEWE
jgi:hypothetical protein